MAKREAKSDGLFYLAGIEPDGMKNKDRIKILILYMLDCVKAPMGEQIMWEVFSEYRLVDYFQFCIAFGELIESGLVEEKGSGAVPTPIGSETGKELYSDLPLSVKKIVANIAAEYISKLNADGERFTKISKASDGYKIEVILKDRNDSEDATPMLKAEIYTATEDSAKMFHEQWMKNADVVFQGIIALMAQDKKSFLEAFEKCNWTEPRVPYDGRMYS